MRTLIKKLQIPLMVFGCTVSLYAQAANIEEKELSRVFHSEALLASWTCRIERANNSPDAEKVAQFTRLTELAFRYWYYSSKGIIERDTRFEKLIQTEFKIRKNIPVLYLEDPICRDIKSIPGFRWTPQEYKNAIEEFNHFILGIGSK